MAADYHEQLTHLCDLQKIDLNLHKFQLRLNEFPNLVREEKEAFNAVKVEFDAVKAELEQIEHDKRNDEQELASSIEHLREREAKLYAIKTNKEYQAALKEVSEGKRINREREDRILKGMERNEELNKKRTQLEGSYADKEKTLKMKLAGIEAEEAEIKSHMEKDQARRPELEGKIDKVILRKYDFIRKRYADAVSTVKNGACEGCLRRIPPQFLNEMMRHEEFKFCPNCQRIIYLEVASEKDEETEK